MFKKNNERIDEVSDPLYFLKDQTLHYINMHFFFRNGLLQKKKKVFLKIFTGYLSTTHTYIYIYIYIHTYGYLIFNT